MVCFGRKTARALRNYLKDKVRLPNEPLFISERGINAGARSTRLELLQLIKRPGIAARCNRCAVARIPFVIPLL